ncbi:MAG: YraN family protein [Oscillospiraceae bacterium]|nr:YraN family protein [Oscillospiraceae bacterium]
METRGLLGAWGEVQAAEYLRKKRYRVIARNVHCRGGEIDLIAEDRRYVVFVEVKTRKNAAFAEAREFVDGHKQARLRLAAEYWLATQETDKQPRFDVIEVYAPEGAATKKPEIRHWESAFE